MDTLKKITPSRLSTLPTLCWTEKGILTSPRITSKLSCFSIRGSYIFQHTIFVTGNPVREHCLLPPRNDPSTVSAHFFQTFQEKKIWLSVWLCIVPVPHLTIYCCWLDQQGGVVIGVTVLQPEDLGSISLDSQSPPCWGALQQDFLPATGMQLWGDAVLTKINPDKTPAKERTLVRQKKTESGSTCEALLRPITYVRHLILVVYFAHCLSTVLWTMWRKIKDCCRDNFPVIILSHGILNRSAVFWVW